MSRRPVIELDRDLPTRPRALAADALSKVFGGCQSAGSCDPRNPQACCPSIGCNRQPDLSYRCSYSSAW